MINLILLDDSCKIMTCASQVFFSYSKKLMINNVLKCIIVFFIINFTWRVCFSSFGMDCKVKKYKHTFKKKIVSIGENLRRQKNNSKTCFCEKIIT